MRGRIIRHTIGQEHKNSEEVWLSHWEIMYLPTHSTRNEKKKQMIYLLFINLKKTYDNILIKMLWKVLQNININHTLVKAVQDLHNNKKSNIKMGSKISKSFTINKGFRQVCRYLQHHLKQILQNHLNNKNKCKGNGHSN